MSDSNIFENDGQTYARLFPLPNLVLFPHVVQPLHIFEPRYRQMTADALDSDKEITLVLPRPGWQKTLAGKPELYSVACLGKIIAEQKLEDGRYNLLLRGETRIRIQEEIPADTLYRQARVELLQDIPFENSKREAELRVRLLQAAPKALGHQGKVVEEFHKLLKSNLPLGTLADIIAFALPLDCDFKQQLLEELDVDRRVRHLLQSLETHGDNSRPFPPKFSSN